MSQLTDLERDAIAAILAEKPEHLAVLNHQLRSVVVEKRENTGGGFFTTLSVSARAPAVILSGPLGLNVYASINGMEDGLGLLLFFEDGRMSLLEGYSVGGENTSGLDFEGIAFSITSEPTSWRETVR